MKWNQFSDEVAKEIDNVRMYGVTNDGKFEIENFPGKRTDSYKDQAKRELAKRLILESMVSDAQKTLSLVVNLLDGVTIEQMHALSGMPLDECKRLKESL